VGHSDRYPVMFDLRDFSSDHCYVHRRNALGRNFYERSGFVRSPAQDSDDEWYLRKVLG